MISTIFVPRGAEADAVRSAAKRARSIVRVVETGIGPLAASLAADEALAGASLGTALVTGLCGSLSPACDVGETLVYREIVCDGGATLALETLLGDTLAARVPGALTGIRAFASERIVTSVANKAALAARTHADAVDMESRAVVERLQQRGVAVAVVRVASDGPGDALPDLDRALDGAGGMDGLALALAMLRRPRAGIALAINGTRALRALGRSIEAVLR